MKANSASVSRDHSIEFQCNMTVTINAKNVIDEEKRCLPIAPLVSDTSLLPDALALEKVQPDL